MIHRHNNFNMQWPKILHIIKRTFLKRNTKKNWSKNIIGNSNNFIFLWL